MRGCGADRLTYVAMKMFFFLKRKIERSKLKTIISQEKSPEERRTGRQQKDSAGKDTPSNVMDYDYDEKLM